MKTLLFVDHAFHTSTASSRFFTDLLKRRFDVKIAYVDPPSNIAAETLALAASADVVVIWQMDYLAPVFLSLGVPTVVAPMYDGSATMPDLHWACSAQAQYINFSFTLHHRIVGLGNRSFLARYFPSPAPEDDRATFDEGLKAFLWQRRPEHGINAPAVLRLLEGQVRSLHVHNAPDVANLDMRPYKVTSTSACEVTQTKWFPKAEDYRAALGRANVFIAPRRAEGIGMATLEAMARGMLIIAGDEPTQNEYVSNWLNGILYNPDEVQSIRVDKDAAEVMGMLAYETVRSGRQQWELQALDILALVESGPPTEPVDIPDLASFSEALSRAYYSGVRSYTAFMLNNADLMSRLAGRELQGCFDEAGQRLSPDHDARDTATDKPWLEEGRVPLWPKQSDRYLTAGALERAGRTAWLRGHCAEFQFRADPLTAAFSTLTIRLELPAGLQRQQLVATLNNWTLGIVELNPADETVGFDLPLHVVKGSNTLRIQAAVVGEGAGVQGFASLGLNEIRFS